MRNRIERFRLWLLAGACLLLAVLAVFIGSARYLRRHALARLSSKLGIDIKSETNGFTYSQSLQGRTIYTIHAAKEIEHQDGKITLHDVSMVLYGRTGDRADTVYGKDFEYDQSAGVVRALGLVHIDLGAAGSGKPGAAPPEPNPEREDDPAGGPRLLHATTSGLVYLDKLGVAATSEAIEFRSGEMTGHAVGADYSTDTGILLLHSDVTMMSGAANGRPVNLSAGSAQLDQRGRRAILSRARYVSAKQTMQADQAILHTRADNSFERIEAQGNVTLASRTGATVSAARADVALAEKNKLQTALLTGGVLYSQNEPLRQAHGEAGQARIAFDADGAPQHALFSGSAHLTERTRPTDDSRQPWSSRDLAADTLDTTMVPVAKGQSALRDAHAIGSAHLTLVESAPGPHAGTTALAGDDIKVHLLPATGPKQSPRLDTLSARGHTLLRQLSAEGVEQTSSADSLDARFQPQVPASPRSSDSRPAKDPTAINGEQLATAIQEGHVHLTRRTPAKPGPNGPPAEFDEATAERASYNGSSNQVSLTGGARLSNAASILTANHIVLDRLTRDAQADGAVKVSYLAEPGADSPTKAGAPAREPIHVIADRAELNHESDVTTFFGKPVRVWQGGSQVQAPIVELARRQRQMSAHGESPSNGHAVHTILTAAPTAEAPADSTRKTAPRQKPTGSSNTPAGSGPVQIDSAALLYSDATRQVRFTGGIRVASSAETITAREGTAFLQPAAPAAAAQPPARASQSPSADSSTLSLDSRIDHIVLNGTVVVDQPGLHATGEKLVYTAADRLVLLTGSPASLPRVLDTSRGTTVTSPAFRFHTTDQSVEALGAAPGDLPGTQRVLADTPVHH